MKYRRLGKTGLRISVVGIGTYQYGGEWGKVFTEDDVLEILRVAEENGINLVDTAECYGDHLAEKLVGAAIRKKRDRWVIATPSSDTSFTAFRSAPATSPHRLCKSNSRVHCVHSRPITSTCIRCIRRLTKSLTTMHCGTC